MLKSSAGEELIAAIHEVIKGHAYVTPLITKDVLSFLMDAARQPDQPAVKLTPRQREIVQLVAEGHSMKEIGTLLAIAPRTVAFHKYRIMEHLKLRTTAQLIHYAIDHHIV